MKKNNFQIIVGIPSYMEADSISFVVKIIDKGLKKYFPQYKSLIVNADNNSPDNTRAEFENVNTESTKFYISTSDKVTGKGNNIYNILKIAIQNIDTLKILILVDADLKSITPDWIKHLGEPVLDGYDYVLPRYSRHQFDGSITNHICYPILYALYGEDLRQPIGGEFALSNKFVTHLYKKNWDQTTRQYGVDIFMTLNAIEGCCKTCETILGTKIHKASGPKLGNMFTQVVTTLFDTILLDKHKWINSPIVKPVVKKKYGKSRLELPQELTVDIKDLKDKLRKSYYDKQKTLKKYLNSYTLSRINAMFNEDRYEMNSLLWLQVVYQLLFAYDMSNKKNRKDIIEALKPLYFARSISFNYKTWRYSPKYAEESILHQAMAFSSQRPYLLGLYLLNNKIKMNEIQ